MNKSGLLPSILKEIHKLRDIIIDSDRLNRISLKKSPYPISELRKSSEIFNSE